MKNPNSMSPSGYEENMQHTGWESIASMADQYSKQNETVNPSKFEKPFENFDTIASAVIEYTHCDLDKNKGFYNAIMTSSVERWYPGIKSSQSPAREKFESVRFKEWKQNIIDLDAQTAIKKYGNGSTFNALKKLHNYLKSGHDASTQTELLNNCFDNYEEYEIAFKKLKYDRHSEPGWMYYSSRDEKLGLEERINADGRLYLNAEPIDTFDIADKFVDACKNAELPYEFKINQFPDRADAMVFYVDNKDIGKYIEILTKILDNNPKISERIGKPPLLSEKVSDKIGYGDENGGTSYNEKQCVKFQKTIEAVVASYRGPIQPRGSTQEQAKALFTNHHDRFLNVLKDRLQ